MTFENEILVTEMVFEMRSPFGNLVGFDGEKRFCAPSKQDARGEEVGETPTLGAVVQSHINPWRDYNTIANQEDIQGKASPEHRGCNQPISTTLFRLFNHKEHRVQIVGDFVFQEVDI